MKLKEIAEAILDRDDPLDLEAIAQMADVLAKHVLEQEDDPEFKVSVEIDKLTALIQVGKRYTVLRDLILRDGPNNVIVAHSYGGPVLTGSGAVCGGLESFEKSLEEEIERRES